MQTSVTGTSTDFARTHAACRGFSLLELMVVVAIVGVFAGAVVLSLRIVGSDREIEQEILRLRSLIDVLREEALMQTRDFGLLFTETGYRFYVYDYQQLTWVEPADDRLLEEHLLRKPLNMSLVIEERPVALAADFESLDMETPEPQVMILSSGELTPFEADVYRDFSDGRFTLTAALDGKLEVAEDGFDSR
jgi:general secretion pathway protein H